MVRCSLLVVPLLTAVVAVTVPLTLVMAYAENNYFDGLRLPFITQASREGSAFWVFATGMTLVWPILIGIGVYTERWLRDVGQAMMLSDEQQEKLPPKPLRCCCRRYQNFGFAMKLCFGLSGFFFALCAWSNHIVFHRNRVVDVHAYGQVAAFALSVTAMSINAYVIGALAKLSDKGGCPSTPPELRAVLQASKRWKTVASVVINICMLAHVPSTYIYEWFCAGNIGPHAPRGTTFVSVAACEQTLGRSAAYCERWRDARNATMTLLYAPPDDACPSLGLSLYNALTQYLAIAAVTLFVATLQRDLRYEPPPSSTRYRTATEHVAVAEPDREASDVSAVVVDGL